MAMAGEKEPTAEEIEAQAEADFESGATMETDAEKPAAVVAEVPKPEVKPAAAEQPPAPPAPEQPPKPKHVQVTEEQFTSLMAAAEKVKAFEGQFSKVFGTLGDVQKTVKTLQTSTPRGQKVEIPKDAFKELEAEFPEMAQRIRTGMEAALRGITGTGTPSAEIDPDKFKSAITEAITKLEVEALEENHPDWRKTVGAIDISKGEKPDPNNPFRKWLLTKDAAYQARVNGTNSSAVISRAIDLFKKETAAPPPKPATPDPKKAQRANRIAAAVQPKGDGRPPAPKTEDDEFEAGFKTG